MSVQTIDLDITGTAGDGARPVGGAARLGERLTGGFQVFYVNIDRGQHRLRSQPAQDTDS